MARNVLLSIHVLRYVMHWLIYGIVSAGIEGVAANNALQAKDASLKWAIAFNGRSSIFGA